MNRSIILKMGSIRLILANWRVDMVREKLACFLKILLLIK